MEGRQPGQPVKIQIPRGAAEVLKVLREAGYEAYVVGGCVRDSLLGRVPNDWDVTTNALPLQVKALFRRTVDTGLKHGTVTALVGSESIEITTYRIDGEYDDGRHPREVSFVTSLAEDLARRDFTINAMAYNETEGLVDLYDGIGDLERKTIRCVGDPLLRFGEDALRMLRAVRFAAQLGYGIEEKTLQAIGELAPTISKVSAERIRVELEKTLCSDHPELFRTAYETGLTAVFLPEFDEAVKTPQNHKHHCYNVGEHILHSIENIGPEPVLRLTMLLHDIGKPRTVTVDEDGTTHFYGHEKVSAEMAKEILRRLRYDNQTIQDVYTLVLCHDLGNGVKPKKPTVRRSLNRIGRELFPLYLQVRRADVLAQSGYQREEKLQAVEDWKAAAEEILRLGECVDLQSLAVSGRDLIREGMKPGPGMGEILKELLEEVLEDPSKNEEQYLLKRAFELQKTKTSGESE